MTGRSGSPVAGQPESGDPAPGHGLDTDKLAAARLWATSRYPYLASAVFAMPTVSAPTVGRLVVDRWWRVHADPVAVSRASVAELGGELLHLTSHLLRDHAGRADELHFVEPTERCHWVDAADAEIADDFPDDVLRVSRSATADDLGCRVGRLAEEYYRQGLVREGHSVDCGSGAHGGSPSWEPPPEDRSGISKDEQRRIRRSVAADVAGAEADAVGLSLRQWAENHLQAKVDWRTELAGLLRGAIGSVSGAVDYSYRRPSRRAAVSPDVVLASLARPNVEVAVVCDTSASVSDELLGAAVAEIDGLLRATGTRSVRVLSCDDAVRTVERVTNGRDVSLIGDGGTDMTVGIEAALEQRPRPDLLIVLTDGFTPWSVQAPPVPVIVGLLETDDDGAVGPAAPPSWAKTVPIGR